MISERRRERFDAAKIGYDLVVVGGGVNGLGMAWDAALRGLRVLVVEKNDFGSGTSSWSSKMIHGGLKYLEKYDVFLVRESLHEREWLLQSAPHLVRELRFLMPFYERDKYSPAMMTTGMVAYDVLSFDKSLKRFKLYTREQILAREPGLDPNGLKGAAIYSDAQVNYAERMSYEIALAAQRAGADLLTWTQASHLKRENGKVTGVTIHDRLDDRDIDVPARAVVNAAGPWIDEVWQADSLGLKRMNGGTKGTHIIVDPFPGAPKEAFYYESDDGRPMMVIPWLDRYIIGSTDLRFTGDLDMASADVDEYEYILHETNKVLPGCGLGWDDVKYSFTGVRPLPYAEGDVADITRRHKIVDHTSDGLEGLWTLVGGKLTTFRQVGEDMGDILTKKFGSKRKSVTRKLALPGGAEKNLERLHQQVRSQGIQDPLAQRLADQYGTRAIEVAALINSSDEMREVLDEKFGLTVGEVTWAVTREDAFRAADVIARRTMIGVENDLGLGVLERVADICADLLGWDEARKQSEIDYYRHYTTRFTPPQRSASDEH